MGRPAPKYWWDFIDNTESIIVQSDYPGGDMLAKFRANQAGINCANELIGDYECGRETPKWKK